MFVQNVLAIHSKDVESRPKCWINGQTDFAIPRTVPPTRLKTGNEAELHNQKTIYIT